MNRIVGLRGEPLRYNHVHEWVQLPTVTPFGNLTAKTFHLVSRLIHANRRLEETEKAWAKVLTQTAPDMDDWYTQHQLGADEVVVHLRRVADELIGLLWLLRMRSSCGEWPQQIRRDSIGRAQHRNGKWFLPMLEPHDWLLRTLNDMSNAQKHSFLNSGAQGVGATEPYAFARGLKENKLSNGVTDYAVPLSALVGAFNSFYQDVMAELKRFAGKV